MDVHDRMKNAYFTNHNQLSFAVNSEFSTHMSMDVGNRMNTQYNTNFTHTVRENEANCAVNRHGTSEFSTNMVFKSHEDMTDWVKTKGRSLGYAIIIRRSRKEENGFLSEVVLMCNRGGIDISKNPTTDKTSKKINCPFQLVGKYSLRECGWTLKVICEKHNHEPALDPHAIRLSNIEYRLVVKLFMKGLKPRAILSILKERHPDNLSTIRTIYNALKNFPKPGNAGTLMGDIVNDQETVSLSPESNPYAFDAKRMKTNVDHTAPFDTGKWVQPLDPAKLGSVTKDMFMFSNGACHDTNAQDAVAIDVSAEDDSALGRPFQPYRDVAFYKPKGQFSSESLSMDVGNRMNAQYNTNFTHTVRENEANCAVNRHVTSEFFSNMVFKSLEDLTDWVKTKGRSLGYVIVIKRSKKEANGVMSDVTLMCDRGGINKSQKSIRNKTSKKINCPFELTGIYLQRYDSWTFEVICEKHNHEPALDMEGHPYAMRLSDKETRLVVKLSRKGLKPQAILSILKKQHPDNLSTLKTIYNAQQKFRKIGNEETLMEDMVDDEETFSAEDEPTLVRPYQPCPDVVFYNPEGQFLDDSLEEDGLQSDVNFDIWNEMNKSMDIEDETNSQYNTNFTQTACENERTHAANTTSEFSTNMVFRSYDDLKHWVQKRGRSLGYVIVTKRSNQKKTKRSSFVSKVILMCDRSGIHKSKSSNTNRTTKKTNCPFQLVGKYRRMHNFWTLRVICEKHNHEPALDMEGHAYAQRLSDDEIRLVVDLARKDVKPQEILFTLKQRNPNNVSTLRTIYNALQKFRRSGHAETITGQMANGEANVSPSPPYTSNTFVVGQIPMPNSRTFPPLQTDLMQNPVKEVSDANLVRDMFMFDKKREGQLLIKQFLKGDYSRDHSSGGETNTTVDLRDNGEYVGVEPDSEMEEIESSSDINVDGFANSWKNMTAGLGSSKWMDVKDRMSNVLT